LNALVPLDISGDEMQTRQNLNDMEYGAMLGDWNFTETDYPSDRCVHEIFADRVEAAPAAVALVCGERRWTYGELNSRANQLAHYLQRLGVGPESLVGVCMERSAEMVVALLAILKAGGAYIPLDPTYPPERLNLMLEDSRARVLFLRGELPDGFRIPECVTTISLDDDARSPAAPSTEPPMSCDPQNAAYVLYTSGSTGRPKGVVVTHRNFVNLLCSVQREPGLTMDDSLLATTTLSFDISGLELFLPLISGAKLIVGASRLSLDIYSLIRQIGTQDITVLQATPTLWRLLIEAGWTGSSNLKVLSGGEALPSDLAERLAERSSSVWNMYGPTETTIWSCTFEVTTQAGAIVPIGRPIANTRVYILDDQMQPMAMEEPGELYIGGAGLARGYLNRPDLTSERFVPDPFGAEPGQRLYRTGDIVRMRRDGCLEFLGRNDQQVKIRGHRIELCEIEGALRGHSGIEEAIVVIREEPAGNKRLIAYLVLSESVKPNVQDLRGFLRHKLPDYMVPSAFVELNALPQTPNGKVDRHALPDPGTAILEATEVYVPPRTRTEELLAGIWASVLRLQRVGVRDPFLELGGHSLLAMQIASRIRDRFHVTVPVRTLYTLATIERVAAAIADLIEVGSRTEAEDIHPIPRDGQLPLSFNQEGRLYLESQTLRTVPFHTSLGLELNGELDVVPLQETISEMVQRHESLRTTFREVGSHTIAGLGRATNPVDPPLFGAVLLRPFVHARATLKILQRNVEDLTVETRQQIIEEEIERPFDYREAPLMRAVLLRIGERKHLLILVVHHLVCDGWSLRVLQKELGIIYESLRDNVHASLPDLLVQHVDFANWQRKLLRTVASEDMVSYWKRQWLEFGHAQLAPADLPFSRSQSSARSFAAGYESLNLGACLSEDLRDFARTHRATPYMVFVAAFGIVLRFYSNKKRIAIWANFANRMHIAAEGAVGWFGNTHILGMDLCSDPEVTRLIEQVGQTVLDSTAHQEIPLALLWSIFLRDPQGPRRPFSEAYVSIDLAMEESSELTCGLRIRPVLLRRKTTDQALSVTLRDEEGKITIVAEYSEETFLKRGVQLMLGNLREILERFIRFPNSRVSTFASLFANSDPADH
jgi:amino acid adenylation domain-containing protein